MANQVYLIPGVGLVKDTEQGNVQFIPGSGLYKEQESGEDPLLPIKLTFKDQYSTTYRKYSTAYRNPITTLSNKSAVFAPTPEPSTFNSSWALGSNVILQPGVIT